MKWKILFQRFMAFSFDYSVYVAMLPALSYVLKLLWPAGVPNHLRELSLLIGFIVVSTSYVVIGVRLIGGTVGLWAFDLTMMEADGNRPAASRVLVRHILSCVSILCLGLGHIYALFDKEGKTFPDAVCGILVDDMAYGIISSRGKGHNG